MSLPPWTALTATLAGHRTAKVVDDDTAWVATVTGTTGAVEPTWPTNDPWVVADGSTSWSLSTSFRVKMMSGLETILTNFIAANPTLLKGYRSARPKSMTNVDLPCIYIEGADETISFPGTQLQQRSMTGLSVVIVDVTPDNLESETRMDYLVDALIGMFATQFHGIDSKSILQAGAVSAIPFEEGGIPYNAYLISLGGTFKTEGIAQSPP